MSEPVSPAWIATQMRVVTILCAALAASLVFYVIIAWYVLKMGPLDLALPSFVPVVLSLIALSILAVAPYLFRLLMAQITSRAAETSPDVIGQGYVRATVVAFALRESAGVIGLVCALLTGNLWWSIVGSAAALLAMFLAWPQSQQLETLLRGTA